MTKGLQPKRTFIVCHFWSQTMADKFQKEISVVMRGELTSVHFFKRTPHSRAIIICHCSYCPLKDKLTAELPVLRSREEGVPLPKVAAHVTGGSVSSFTEPPPADGEDTRREFGKWMLNPKDTPNALTLTDGKQTEMNLDRQAGAVCCTVAPVHVCACSAAAPEAMECAASLFPAALTSRCLSEPAAAFVSAGASRPLLLSCRETKHVLLFFSYFNSCSVGGESSLMCKKYVIELPQKSPPFAAFASWTLFGKNMRLWTLTLCDITEGTGMSRRSVATPPVRPPETLCV